MAISANTPPNPQAFLLSTDLRYARELLRWLEEELQMSVADVTDVEILGDVIEVPSDTQWRSFIPGKFTHFHLTFADGQRAYKTFVKGASDDAHAAPA